MLPMVLSFSTKYLPFLNHINSFSTGNICCTRTRWSKERIRIRHPICVLPRYLLDGGIKKGHKQSGRNSTGHITTRHKKGTGRRNYRIVDFLRVPFTKDQNSYPLYKDEVVAIAYDPCRSALVAQVAGNISQKYRLILAATGMKVGDVICSSRGPPPPEHIFTYGDTFPLKYFPKDSFVYNIELKPGEGGKMARAGNSYFCIKDVKNNKNKVEVILTKNSRFLVLDGDNLASYGTSRACKLHYMPLGKAGRARRYGKGRGGKKGIARLRKIRPRGRKNMPYRIK